MYQLDKIANMGSDKTEKKMRKLRERAEQLEAQARELMKEAEQARAQLAALEEAQTDVSTSFFRDAIGIEILNTPATE